MTFIPFFDKIEIEPIGANQVIQTSESNFLEKGKVISVGDDVTFVKPGDIVYFDSWGCMKTPEIDGKVHYVVAETNQIILGKEEHGEE